jgi:hypothetical protein
MGPLSCGLRVTPLRNDPPWLTLLFFVIAGSAVTNSSTQAEWRVGNIYGPGEGQELVIGEGWKDLLGFDRRADQIHTAKVQLKCEVRLGESLDTGAPFSNIMQNAAELWPVDCHGTHHDHFWTKQHVGLIMILLMVQMNSFSTSDDTREFLAKTHSDLLEEPDIELLQNKSPKVDAATLEPVSYPEDADMEWCAHTHPDHIDADSGRKSRLP